jgi:hypothetical protein
MILGETKACESATHGKTSPAEMERLAAVTHGSLAPLKEAYRNLKKAFSYEMACLRQLPPEKPAKEKAIEQLKKNETEAWGCNEEDTFDFLIRMAKEVVHTLHCFGLGNTDQPSGINMHKLFKACIFNNDLFSTAPLLGLTEPLQEKFLHNQVYKIGDRSTRLFFPGCTVHNHQPDYGLPSSCRSKQCHLFWGY